jgi:hypothetical protein
MRYHWGLGVGHLYSHSQAADVPATAQTFHTTIDTAPEVVLQPCLGNNQYGETDAENPEFGFENREDDWIDVEENFGEDRYEDDDDALVAMDDMYGSAEQE